MCSIDTKRVIWETVTFENDLRFLNLKGLSTWYYSVLYRGVNCMCCTLTALWRPCWHELKGTQFALMSSLFKQDYVNMHQVPLGLCQQSLNVNVRALYVPVE